MFHFRLAARLGVSDVDALIDSLTPDQVREWMAAACVDGWFQGDWVSIAHTVSAVHNTGIQSLAADGKIKPHDLKRHFLDPQDYIDANTAPTKKRKRSGMNPKQLGNFLRAKHGTKRS